MRGIGETTDVVTKEMYTFEDRGGRSMTLRPENTASVVRAFLQHKLYGEEKVHKFYYMGPMFRHDVLRPDGIVSLRSSASKKLVRAILLSMQNHRHGIPAFHELGLNDLVLHLNSVGCKKCRPVYRQKLLDFFADKKDMLCDDCNARLEKILSASSTARKMAKDDGNGRTPHYRSSL